MLLYITKFAVTALIIVVVSEVAKRTDRLGALIAALPLVTIMVMVWLHIERQSDEKIARHAFYTFWYVIPTLPMFLLMPWLLSRRVSFWASLAACVAVTVLSFWLTARVAALFSVDLIPNKQHDSQSGRESATEETLPDEASEEQAPGQR